MYTAIALGMLPFQRMRYTFEHGAVVPDNVRDSRAAMARENIIHSDYARSLQVCGLSIQISQYLFSEKYFHACPILDSYFAPLFPICSISKVLFTKADHLNQVSIIIVLLQITKLNSNASTLKVHLSRDFFHLPRSTGRIIVKKANMYYPCIKANEEPVYFQCYTSLS